MLVLMLVAAAAGCLRLEIDALHDDCRRRADQLAQFELLVTHDRPAGAAVPAALGMLDGLFPGERLVARELTAIRHLDLQPLPAAGARP
jgi:hypothetical protein